MGGRFLFEWVQRYLSAAEPARKCDAIFVLAGGRERKALGLQLYKQDYAPRILLSVGRFEIWRFGEMALPYPPGREPIDLLAAAQPIPPPERHFFVELDGAGVRFEKIQAGRLGTLREIRALAEWCERNPDIKSLTLVSSGYHLRRVRICCRALLPSRVRCVFVAAPEEEATPVLKLVREAFKVAMYRAILMLRRLSVAVLI